MLSKYFLGEGSNINHSLSFIGECYDFWKIQMRIFVEYQDLDIWNAIEEGPYTPFVIIDETTHEGTLKVKSFRLNTHSQEYDMFCMKSREKILNLQKRFIQLTNHLIALGKVLSNSDLNLKFLRSLTKTWQPKETVISKKKKESIQNITNYFFLEIFWNTSCS
ncbi:hypothetical protein Lal_00031996 [Lupinus albus]|nr:hypothetical protein Lal_00031996 [Lupinus albus]